MKNRMNKIDADGNFGKALFHIGLVLMLLSIRMYEFSGPAPDGLYMNLWRAAFVILCLRIILFAAEKPRYAAVSLSIIAVSTVLFTISDNKEILTMAALVCSAQGVSRKDFLRTYIITVAVILVTAVPLFSCGIIADVGKHWHGWTGHSLGFSNPNALAMSIMTLTCAILCFKGPKDVLHLAAVTSAVAVLVGVLTLSRSTSILLLSLPLWYLLMMRHKPSPALFAALPVVGLLGSMLLALYFGPVEGDMSLVSRFSIPRLMVADYGLSAFGGTDFPLPLDNHFLASMLKHGWVAGTALLLLYCGFHYKAAKDGTPMLRALTIILFLMSFVEYAPMNIIFNFLFVYLMCNENRKTAEIL